MLANKKLTIINDVIVGDNRIASFGAIIDLDTLELSMTSRYIDKEACKVYKDVVRVDQADFEDYAYMVQDMLVTE